MMNSERLLAAKYGAQQMMYWVGYLTIFSFTAVFLLGRGFSATEIGYVTTVGAILTILLQVGISSLADRSQRISLKGILAALFIGCITAASVMLLLPKSHIATFVGMFTALSLTATQGTFMTSLCLQYNKAGHKINFGVARSLGSLGYALAGFVMGRLTEAFGAEVILPVYCACYSLMLLVLLTMERPVRTVQVPAAAAETREQPSNMLRFFTRDRRYDVFLLAVISMFFMQMILNTYMIYFIRNYGGTESDMGTVLFVAAFSEMPAVAIGLKLLRKFGAEKLLRVSSITNLVKCTAMLFIPNSTYYIALQVLQFFYSGLYMVASVYFANSIVGEADAVKAQAILAVALSGVAGIAANIIGGYMVERVPIRIIILMGTAVAAAGVALMFIATGKRFFKDQVRDVLHGRE